MQSRQKSLQAYCSIQRTLRKRHQRLSKDDPPAHQNLRNQYSAASPSKPQVELTAIQK